MPERRRRNGEGRAASERGAKRATPDAPRTGRELARQVLARVEQDGAFAGRALSAALDRARALSAADRGLATELVYGVLRRRARLDRALDAVADRGLASLEPDVRIALRVGAYQLLFLTRVPAYAAVNETVESMKRSHGPRLGGLANALMRRVSERGEPPLPDTARDPVGYLVEACGFPEWLARLAIRERGAAAAVALADAMSAPAPLCVRANRLHGMTRDALAPLIAAESPDVSLLASALAPDGALARGFEGAALGDAFTRGQFAIQDIGAQVVTELCGAAAGDRVLDACAGLGGKTAHLAALAGNRARIDAVDLSAAKLGQAKAQWQRLGVRGVSARIADLTQDLPTDAGPYDRVLLDAPCAGLGVLRRHPEVLLRRTEVDLALLAATQRRMLDVVAARVAPGGVLVYAVCTFDNAEGVDVIRSFLASHDDFRVEGPAPAGGAAAGAGDDTGGVPWDRITDDAGFIRTWPHADQPDDADAFFMARLRRAATDRRT